MNAAKEINKPKRWKRIVYFFPFQLVLLHFKRNHLLMVFWLLMFLFVGNLIGSKYGVSALLLAPEYMGKISWLSFGIMGFAFGGFLMAFNIYSYILHANEFRFLATLSRPFLKFCYNNIIIPFAFYFTHSYFSFQFQVEEELMSGTEASLNLLAYSFGIFIFIMFSMIFFTYFNKNIFKLSGKDETYYDSLPANTVKEGTFMKETTWYKRMSRKRVWKIHTYISSPFSIKLARNTSHYDKRLLKQVFAQNHINASIFEIVLILSFISLGFFRDINWMNIPAAASLFLLFTLFLLVFSALYSWLKRWTVTVLIIALASVNFISNKFDGFRFRNYAYGIDYSVKNEYSWNRLTELNQDKVAYEESMRSGIAILENWKKRNQKFKPNSKPKLILVNISGGGLRASVWAMEVLQELEKGTNGDFFRHSQLITGASGGMIGATYYRELYRKQLVDSSINTTSKRYTEQLGEDLLNPLAFGIATTDFLFRYQKLEDGNYSYTKDRGYSFEQRLIKNLGGTFDDKRLEDYYNDEYLGNIPMMIYSPSVVNDGRRLLISPQKISYLSYNKDTNYVSTYSSMENVEYTRLFEKNDPYNLKITSAMRMSATFPYILPMVTMPTDPPIELMDAGIRDNYGLKTSLEYMRVFKNWISTNTSGVILVQIRDKQKNFEIINPNNGTILQRILTPFTSFYSNTVKIHDYTNDQLLRSVPDWYNGNFESITFYIDQEVEKPISMSWHLTSLDKESIKKAFQESNNQKALERLKTLLDIE